MPPADADQQGGGNSYGLFPFGQGTSRAAVGRGWVSSSAGEGRTGKQILSHPASASSQAMACASMPAASTMTLSALPIRPRTPPPASR